MESLAQSSSSSKNPAPASSSSDDKKSAPAPHAKPHQLVRVLTAPQNQALQAFFATFPVPLHPKYGFAVVKPTRVVVKLECGVPLAELRSPQSQVYQYVTEGPSALPPIKGMLNVLPHALHQAACALLAAFAHEANTQQLSIIHETEAVSVFLTDDYEMPGDEVVFDAYVCMVGQ